MPNINLTSLEEQPKFESQTPSISLPATFKQFEGEKAWLCSNSDKKPVSPITGKSEGYNCPKNWGDFACAKAYLEKNHGHTLAIVLGAIKGLVCIDLDDVIDANGTLASWANDLLQQIDSYTEISSSCRGLHIFALGAKNGDRCKGTCGDGHSVEIYGPADTPKPIKLTGNIYRGRGSINPSQAAIDQLCKEVLSHQRRMCRVRGLKAQK